MSATVIPMRDIASSSNPPGLATGTSQPVGVGEVSEEHIPGGTENASLIPSSSDTPAVPPSSESPPGGDNGTRGLTYFKVLFKNVGNLMLAGIAIPMGIWKCVSGNASQRTLHTDSEKVKAGQITMVILVIVVGLAIGLPCGLDKCEDDTNSSTGPQPTAGGSGDGGQKPLPVAPTKTPGGIAHPCQPNFGGAVLSVNGSYVEWGISGDTVIAQNFDPSVPEFYFYFTGAPTNLYNIQPVNESRTVINASNTLILAPPNSQNIVPSWNVSCEVCGPSGFIVKGRFASACNITITPSAGSQETCVQLPDMPLGKSLTLAPCTGQNNQNFDFWVS